MRYRVTSNASEGFDGVFRGYPPKTDGGPGDYPAGKGWKWPRAGIEIEVVEQDTDPGPEFALPPGVERAIGQRTWAALQQDPRIFAGPVGSGEGGVATSAALAEANAKIAALEAMLAAGKTDGEPAPAQPAKGKSK